MPEIVVCPACQNKLRWRDFQEGTYVKCPACACLFAPPADAMSPAPDNQVSSLDTAPEQPPVPVEVSLPSLEIEPTLPPPAPFAPEIQSSQPPSPTSSDFELTYSPPPLQEEEEFVAVLAEDEQGDQATIPFAPGEVSPPKPVAPPPRRRKRPRSTPSGWDGVFSGLGFVLASLGVLTVFFLLGTCGTMVTAKSDYSADNPQPGSGTAAAAGGVTPLLVLGWAAGVCIYGLMITGHAFCLSAPTKHGARALAYVTLLLALADVLMWLGGQFLGLSLAAVPPGAGPTVFFFLSQMAALGPWVCSLAHLLVFLFFLRAVALGVEAYSLAETVVGVMIVFGVGSVVFLGADVVAVMIGSELVLVQAAQGQLDLTTASDVGVVLGVVGALGLLVWLAAMIWYVNTLFQIRYAVGLQIKGSTWTPSAP
jgi:hypothetical protein